MNPELKSAIDELNGAAKFNIRPPYLIFLAEQDIPQRAKTATGLYYWRPELCVGQHRLDGPEIWKGLLPLEELSMEEGIARGAKSLVLGSMNFKENIPASWLPTLVKAASLGLDIVNGSYESLAEIPAVQQAAKKSGAQLIDLRFSKLKFPEMALKYAELNKAMFGKRRPGKRCLAIGTDLAVGKMFTMLALEREMRHRGIAATFRATGQIGVLIAGGAGIAHDALPGDYMVGTVECLTHANEPNHWDLVEGQGSIFHPYFSPSTIALMYGTQPDALVICHDLGRKTTLLGLPIQSLEKLRDISLELCRVVNPDVKLVAVSLNTSTLSETDAIEHLKQVEAKLGVPAVDPVRNGVGRIVDKLKEI